MSQLSNIRVRFAPSPTGELHLGSARTALFNYLFAKNNQGKFLLRIEDTDTERSRKVHIEQAINSIRWLGLKPDEEIVFQSRRSKIYKKYLNYLLTSGKAYRCFASKKELQLIRQKTNSFQYNGLWRNKSDEEINEQLELGSPHTIRLKTPNKGHIVFDDLIYGEIRVSNSEIDDFIIRRSDGSPVYNFTNVVDDHDMGISHVIRGEDHVSNTPKQLHIYQSLGFDNPFFAHLPMILGEDKKKLSKRHGAESVESYRDKGFQPGPLINYLALLGWNPGTNEEIMDLTQLISKYDVQKVQKKSAVFDSKKFSWVSSQYLIKQDLNTILQSIRSLEPSWGANKTEDFCMRVIDLMIPRCNFIGDIIKESHYFFDYPKAYNLDDQKKVWKEKTAIILKDVMKLYEKVDCQDHQGLEGLFKEYIKSSGHGFGQVMKPMRLAICGSLTGPSLFDLMDLIGIDDSLKRISKYKNKFNND
ncbi:MAG: glutamate--tRNA ligase [Candidatus Neomarinimicrobiota bacterium]